MDNIQTEKAVFAAGCFWGVEEAFRKVPGVTDARVGYTGGTVSSPTYDKVCGGDTGHSEAVTITFNPKEVSYNELLDVFWSLHDPTQEDGQGFDIGDQYRSAIFYTNDEQKQMAIESRDKLQASGKYAKQIITKIAEADEFFEAEEYHQQYLSKKKDKSNS